MIQLAKIISGGQTGVDRAALDAAHTLGIDSGGWCPKGRLAEDGRIPDRYPLIEMPTPEYPPRTRKNVEEADGTLILLDVPAPMATGGTALTIRIARESGKPWRPVTMTAGDSAVLFARSWLLDMQGKVVNVAGPRESGSPGIYERAKAFLLQVLRG